MARIKQPACTREIVLNSKGKTYKANYYVESGVVTVEAMSEDAILAKNTAQIGGSTAELVARVLLKELIDAGRVLEDQA